MRNLIFFPLFLAATLALAAQEPADQPLADIRKSIIEDPIKASLLSAHPLDSKLGFGLGPNELPPLTADAEAVAPGDVRWHESFESALESSRESGKPVLLFQLLGRLDERFC